MEILKSELEGIGDIIRFCEAEHEGDLSVEVVVHDSTGFLLGIVKYGMNDEYAFVPTGNK